MGIGATIKGIAGVLALGLIAYAVVAPTPDRAQQPAKLVEAPSVPPVDPAQQHRKAIDDGRAIEADWQKFRAAKSGGLMPPAPYNVDDADQALAAIPADGALAQDAAALRKRLQALKPELAKAYAAEEKKLQAARGMASEKDLLDKRKLAPKLIEKTFLDRGLDLYASAEGKEMRTLRIKYVLMSRPMVHQIGNNSDLVSGWRDLGFRKVVLTDGYNSTWTMDLK